MLSSQRGARKRSPGISKTEKGNSRRRGPVFSASGALGSWLLQLCFSCCVCFEDEDDEKEEKPKMDTVTFYSTFWFKKGFPVHFLFF